MLTKNSVKREAFREGFVGFYTGKQQKVTYSKSPNEITRKAWQMTGDSLRKAMDSYDNRRN